MTGLLEPKPTGGLETKGWFYREIVDRGKRLLISWS